MISDDSARTSFDLASMTNPTDTSPTGSDDAEKSRHLKNLEVLVSDLNAATKLILLSGRQRYNQVAALVTCWPDKISDRKHIRVAAQNLCDVFKDQYKFDVNSTPYEIPESKSHNTFNTRLLQSLNAVDSDKPPERPEDRTNLFILYYGGHAVEKDNKMVWRPKENAESLTEVIWTSLLDNFIDVNCDILFLFDCCYAGELVDYGRVFKQRCEVFCASSREEMASGLPQHSFTRALVGELQLEAQMRNGCEIKRLHSILNLKEKKSIYDLQVEPYWDEFTRRRKTSICISPLGVKHPTSTASGAIIKEMEILSDARVLFKATFEDPETHPVLQEWKEFLCWRPSNLKDIEWFAFRETEMHCLFRTKSSSAIMSTPMFLWDSMPKRSAYEFICVIRSSDRLGNLPRRIPASCRHPIDHRASADDSRDEAPTVTSSSAAAETSVLPLHTAVTASGIHLPLEIAVDSGVIVHTNMSTADMAPSSKTTQQPKFTTFSSAMSEENPVTSLSGSISQLSPNTPALKGTVSPRIYRRIEKTKPNWNRMVDKLNKAGNAMSADRPRTLLRVR